MRTWGPQFNPHGYINVEISNYPANELSRPVSSFQVLHGLRRPNPTDKFNHSMHSDFKTQIWQAILRNKGLCFLREKNYLTSAMSDFFIYLYSFLNGQKVLESKTYPLDRQRYI